jgi:transposase InsO family protein
MTRQNYYAKRRERERKKIDAGLIVELVKMERHVQPRLGGRKLLRVIGKELRLQGVRVGRDRFFEVLGAHDLLVKRKKAFNPKTTNSRHSLPVFENLVSEREATAPNQIWVSDLTYIRTREGFIYGSLTTDAYSRKIVGANAGDSLEADGCLRALDEALGQLPAWKFPIHHSDRGSQYCSHRFVGRLLGRGCSVSMTEEDHCAENALAERMNGILKQEYGLDQEFLTKKQAVRAFKDAVNLYNHRRPHMSLGYRIPGQVHGQEAA